MILVAAVSFLCAEAAAAALFGTALADVLGAAACIAGTCIFLRATRARSPWRFEGERSPAPRPSPTRRELLLPWLPYVVVTALMIAANVPAVRRLLAGEADGLRWLALRAVVYHPGKPYRFAPLQNPSTLMVLGALVSFPFLRIPARLVAEQTRRTARQLVPTAVAVAAEHRHRIHRGRPAGARGPADAQGGRVRGALAPPPGPGRVGSRGVNAVPATAITPRAAPART